MRSLGFGLSSSLCSPDFTGVNEALGERGRNGCHGYGVASDPTGWPSLSLLPSSNSDSCRVTGYFLPENPAALYAQLSGHSQCPTPH